MWMGMIVWPYHSQSSEQYVAPTTPTASIHLRNTAFKLWKDLEAGRGYEAVHDLELHMPSVSLDQLAHILCMLLGIGVIPVWLVSPFHYGGILIEMSTTDICETSRTYDMLLLLQYALAQCSCRVAGYQNLLGLLLWIAGQATARPPCLE